jgi:ABC-type cobalamin transport system ATPase subunit
MRSNLAQAIQHYVTCGRAVVFSSNDLNYNFSNATKEIVNLHKPPRSMQ